jgi:co-chaperonin GroES (HSP10)
MKYRAYGEWVVVQADPRVKKTAGGLVLTDQLVQIERTMEGTGRILSIGPKVIKLSLGLEPGSRVAYRGFLKDVHKIDKADDDSDIFVIHYNDLLAAVDEETRLGAFS